MASASEYRVGFHANGEAYGVDVVYSRRGPWGQQVCVSRSIWHRSQEKPSSPLVRKIIERARCTRALRQEG